MIHRHHNRSSDPSSLFVKVHTVGLFENGPITHLASRGIDNHEPSCDVIHFQIHFLIMIRRVINQNDRNHLKYKSLFKLKMFLCPRINIGIAIRVRRTDVIWTICVHNWANFEKTPPVRAIPLPYTRAVHKDPLPSAYAWFELRPSSDRRNSGWNYTSSTLELILNDYLELSRDEMNLKRCLPGNAYFSWIIKKRHLKLGSPSIWPTMTHQIFTRDRSKNNKVPINWAKPTKLQNCVYA